MENLIHVVVPAWGEVSWMAQPCLESLARRWPGMPEQVTALSFDSDISLPEGTRLSLHQGGATRFSDAFLELALEIEEPIIYFTSVDLFLLDDLDDRMELLALYLLYKGALRGNVALDPALELHAELVENWHGLEIIRCNSWRDCSLAAGLGMDVGLFNRVLLPEVLRPGWSIAQTEVWGSIEARNRGMLSVGTRPALTRRAELHCSSTSQPFYWNLGRLDEEDAAIIRKSQPVGINWSS